MKSSPIRDVSTRLPDSLFVYRESSALSYNTVLTVPGIAHHANDGGSVYGRVDVASSAIR